MHCYIVSNANLSCGKSICTVIFQYMLLIENYAHGVKENGCEDMNSSYTMENTLKLSYRLKISRIFYWIVMLLPGRYWY